MRLAAMTVYSTKQGTVKKTELEAYSPHAEHPATGLDDDDQVISRPAHRRPA